MLLAELHQTPSDVLDYTVDFTSWLGLVSDTISSVTWIVPSGLTSSSASNTTLTATIFLTGGVSGSRYVVTLTIVTAASPSRTKRASFGLTIEGEP